MHKDILSSLLFPVFYIYQMEYAGDYPLYEYSRYNSSNLCAFLDLMQRWSLYEKLLRTEFIPFNYYIIDTTRMVSKTGFDMT